MPATPIPAELLTVREQIDRIDQGLVLLLANRFALTQRVGELKAEHNLNSFDPERENRKLEAIRLLCEEHGVCPTLMADILARVMREVVKNHETIKAEKSSL
ncbi:MAG: chorismate mutase [Pseudohongiellaceae bacterium]|nr:chorismate mutase [Pseudohongiellaceae bacterium]